MSYPGSKGQAGTFQRIIGQMPPHHTYIEAFYGGGFIFRHKRPALINVAIDKRKDVLPAKPPEGWPTLKRYTPMPPDEREVKFFVQTVHACAVEFFERVLLNGPDDQPSTLVYCDPPYVLSTRQGRFYYDHEMSDTDHVALLTVLLALHCNVLISGYPSDLYSSHLQNWRCMSYRTRTRGRTVTECLWANFEEPTELHDWRFAGKNFRERTSLKRLAARYLARLQNMAPRKRGYILNALRERTTDPSGNSGVGGSL